MKKVIVSTLVMFALAAISGQAAAVNILVTAESDSGSVFHDMSIGDGVQNVSSIRTTVPSPNISSTGATTVVDENPANARIGSRSISFSKTEGFIGVLLFDGTEGTALGSEFTLAAFVKPNLDGSIRLFTNYPGGGGVGAGVVLFDCYGNGETKTMRLFSGGLNNNTEVTFTPGMYYHLAATYNHGESKLYVNGSQVGVTKTGGADTPNLVGNLQFGEDLGGAANSEQFIGNADDLLILSRVLSDAEVLDMASKGVIGSVLAPFAIAMDPADPNGVELITPVPGLYGYEVAGTEIAVTALASKCQGADLFEFVRWEGNVADPLSASTSTIVDANDVVTAVYTKTSGACELATLTLGITPAEVEGQGLMIPAAGSYSYVMLEGHVVALNAQESVMQCPYILTFDHWEGEVDDASSASTTVLMDKSKTVTAIYVVVECGTIAEHIGSNDPQDEGFTLTTGIDKWKMKNVAYAHVEDGVESWRIDSEDDSLVQYTALVPEGAFVDPSGWTLTGKIKLIEEGPAWGVSLTVCDGVKNYAMAVRDGSVIAPYLANLVLRELDTKDDFHTYQIAYDPFSEEVSYFVDGVLCLSSAESSNYTVPRVTFGDLQTAGLASDQLVSQITLQVGYPDSTQVNITTNGYDAILAPAINLPIGITEVILGTELTLAAESVFVDVNDIDLASSRQYDFEKWVIDGVTYTTPEVAITVDTAVEAQAFYNNVAATLYDVTIVIEGDGNDPNLTEPDPGTFTVVKYATDIVNIAALPIKINCPGILDFIHWDANGSIIDTAYQTQVLIEGNTTLKAFYQARTILGSCGTITIPVVNGDFEDPDVGVGHTAAGTIPGWSIDAGSFNWVEKRKYIGSYDSQVALVGGGSSEKRISQVLSASVSPSTEYAISVDLINSDYPGIASWMFTDWAVRLETVDGELIAEMSGDTHGYPPLNEEGTLGDSLPYNVIGTGVTGAGDRDSRVGKEMRIAIIVPPAEYLILVDNVKIGATGQLFDLTVDADPNYVEITPAIGSYTFIEGTTVTLKTEKATLDCPDFLAFDQWVGSEVADPFSSTTAIVVDGNKSVTATYAISGACEELGLYLRNPDLDEPALVADVSQSTVWGVPAGFWVPTLATADDSCGISNMADSMFDSPSPNSGGQFGIIHTAGVMTNNVYQVIGATFCDGQTYSVSADLGWPNQDSWQFTEYSISLVSAKTGEIVAQATHENQSPALPDPNDWITVTASGVAPASVDGDKIKVIVGGYNSEDFAYDSIRVAGPSVMVSLTISADPEVAADAVSPVGQTSYPFPAMVAINAEDAVDCPDRLVFAEWFGSGIGNPDSASTLVKMDEDKTLVALYDRQEAYYNECGDICHPYPNSDRTEDCVVNLQDLAWLSERWMLPVALVRNGDFESPYIAPGSSARGQGVIDDWNQDVQYMYHDHRDVTIFGAEGIADGAWLSVWPNTCRVSQILTEPVAPDEEYTFILDVGMSQHWIATTGYSARLETVDGEVLVEIDETDGMPGVNQIITLSESVTTGPEGTDPRVGKDMRVVLMITEGGSAGIIYDNVKVLFSGMYDIEDLYLMANEWLEDVRP